MGLLWSVCRCWLNLLEYFELVVLGFLIELNLIETILECLKNSAAFFQMID